MDDTCKQEVFTFRQPEQIEVKKYGSTLIFLRSLLERLGYELIPRDAKRQPPEIEVLVEWLCGENTLLAKEHPEWAMTRDMVVIFKFLATMDSREAELMRRRKQKQQFMWWQLSFEEGGRRSWWQEIGRTGESEYWEYLQAPISRWREMQMDGQAGVEFAEQRCIYIDICIYTPS